MAGIFSFFAFLDLKLFAFFAVFCAMFFPGSTMHPPHPPPCKVCCVGIRRLAAWSHVVAPQTSAEADANYDVQLLQNMFEIKPKARRPDPASPASAARAAGAGCGG